MRRDLTTRSIILETRDRLEIGRQFESSSLSNVGLEYNRPVGHFYCPFTRDFGRKFQRQLYAALITASALSVVTNFSWDPAAKLLTGPKKKLEIENNQEGGLHVVAKPEEYLKIAKLIIWAPIYPLPFTYHDEFGIRKARHTVYGTLFIAKFSLDRRLIAAAARNRKFKQLLPDGSSHSQLNGRKCLTPQCPHIFTH